MKSKSLLLLRITLGLLILLWGIDKLVNPAHGIKVSDTFYSGVLSSATVLQIVGVLEVLLGLTIIVGYLRHLAYPVLIVVTGLSLLAVWRSIIDPWGWYLTGGNVLFFPSTTIFASALVLHAFRADDTISIDARREAAPARAMG